MHTHDIGVKWINCTVHNCCTSQYKIEANLKQHLMHTYDTNVKWFYWTQAYCTSQFKSNTNLKQHLMLKYDIGGVEDQNSSEDNYANRLKANSNLQKEKSHIIPSHKSKEKMKVASSKKKVVKKKNSKSKYTSV